MHTNYLHTQPTMERTRRNHHRFYNDVYYVTNLLLSERARSFSECKERTHPHNTIRNIVEELQKY